MYNIQILQLQPAILGFQVATEYKPREMLVWECVNIFKYPDFWAFLHTTLFGGGNCMACYPLSQSLVSSFCVHIFLRKLILAVLHISSYLNKVSCKKFRFSPSFLFLGYNSHGRYSFHLDLSQLPASCVRCTWSVRSSWCVDIHGLSPVPLPYNNRKRSLKNSSLILFSIFFSPVLPCFLSIEYEPVAQ